MQLNNKRLAAVVAIFAILSLSGLYWLSQPRIPADFDAQKWFEALATGNVNYIKSELARGVPGSVVRPDGWSSLRVAVAANRYQLAQLLLENGAAIDDGDNNTLQPILQVALANDNPFLVALLLKAGSDPARQNKFKKNARELALLNMQYDSLAELVVYDKSARKFLEETILPELSDLLVPPKDGEEVKFSAALQQKAKDHNIEAWAYIKGRMLETDQKYEESSRYYFLSARLDYLPALLRITYLASHYPLHDLSHDAATDLIDRSCNARDLAEKIADVALSGQLPYVSLTYGRCLLSNYPEPEQKQLAVRLIRKAADDGNVLAQGYFGHKYHRLVDSDSNEEARQQSIHYLTLAATQGHANAARDLALVYMRAKDIPDHMEKALFYFDKAGQLGLTYVYSDVAYKFQQGGDVEQNLSKAVEWYNKAVAAGDAGAAQKLAEAYEEGELGLAKDPLKAMEYRNKFAGTNNQAPVKPAVAEWLPILYKNDKAAVEKLMKNTSIASDTAKEIWLYAALLGNQPLLDTLLNKGMDINTVYDHTTALIQAAGSEHKETFQWLIEKGADIELSGTYTSPLFMATSAKRAENLKTLVSHGVDVNKTVNGKTALMQAIDADNIDGIKLLLAKGADINAKDALGKSVYEYARNNALDEIHQLILKDPKLALDQNIKQAALSQLENKQKYGKMIEQWANGGMIVRLDKNGKPLPDQKTKFASHPWACVQDQMTDLTWIVKTDNGDLNDKDNYYWHPSMADPSSKTKCTQNACDTETYLKSIQQAKVCGYGDWRFPTADELSSLTFPMYDAAFPQWPGFAVWGQGDESENSRQIIWANGLFGRTTAVIAMPQTAKTLMVRGKYKPLPVKNNADFTIISFE